MKQKKKTQQTGIHFALPVHTNDVYFQPLPTATVTCKHFNTKQIHIKENFYSIC